MQYVPWWSPESYHWLGWCITPRFVEQRQCLRVPPPGFCMMAKTRGEPEMAVPRWSEGVAQGELDQPGSTDGAGDFAEGAVGDADGFHVVDRGIAEVGVIPDIEEVGGEAQGLALGDVEIFDEREVPVLLAGTAEDVAAEIAEIGRAEVGVHGTLGRVEQRRGGEGGGIQVAVNA